MFKFKSTRARNFASLLMNNDDVRSKILFRLAFAPICLACLAACSEDTFPKYSELTQLRVVALVANTPEVLPGANVTITPYVSDSEGAGRALTFSADSCVDFGVAYGLDPSCIGNPTKTNIATDQAVNGLSAANVYTNAVNALTVAVPLDAVIFNGRSSIDQYNGVNYLVTYSVKSADGSSLVKSFKRILVSAAAKATKNSNPVLNDLLGDGAAFTTLPSGRVSLTPSYAAGSNESYTSKNSSGTVVSATEDLTVSWFSTAGSVKFSRTVGASSNEYTPPGSVPAIGKVVLIGVLRDGRGGTAIVQKNL